MTRTLLAAALLSLVLGGCAGSTSSASPESASSTDERGDDATGTAEPEPDAPAEESVDDAAPEVMSDIACESADDCWVEDGTPVARPPEHRGESFEPCTGGEESAPVCYEGRCGLVFFGC